MQTMTYNGARYQIAKTVGGYHWHILGSDLAGFAGDKLTAHLAAMAAINGRRV